MALLTGSGRILSMISRLTFMFVLCCTL